MRRMTMQESKFGAPVGTYQAKFVGVEDRESDQYGAGLEWKFEIVEGEFTGKVVSRTTAPAPTAKNSCGKLINQLAGGTVAIGQEVDIDSFVGRVYSVLIEENGTGNGTRVGSVMPVSPSQPAAPSTPP